MIVYRQVHDSIKATQGPDGHVVRLMKLSEEVGEVTEAFIGLVGANKRKGFTHTEIDIAKELCDVIVTAHVALFDWIDEPELFLKAHLQGLTARIREEGS